MSRPLSPDTPPDTPHGSREAARGKRVPSIFSGNSQWLDYIEHDDAGYGIKLE